jgi:hypothetical protein
MTKVKTKVEITQEHPKDRKTRIGFNNIEILSSKFQEHV